MHVSVYINFFVCVRARAHIHSGSYSKCVLREGGERERESARERERERQRDGERPALSMVDEGDESIKDTCYIDVRPFEEHDLRTFLLILDYISLFVIAYRFIIYAKLRI